MPAPERSHILDPLYSNWALVSPFVVSGAVVGTDVVLTMDDGSTVTIPGIGGVPSPPTGPAGGDLSGTYPNPSVVDDSHLHTALTLPSQIVYDGDAAGGDLTGSYPNPTLGAIGSATGPIGSATIVPVVTIDAKGRTTALTSASIQIAESQVTNLVSDLAGKQPTGNYITALTGDVAATGPGSAAATLATVNSNVGSFGTASNVPTITVNAKGLTTAAANTPIQIAESQVTSLVADLALKAPLANPVFTGDPQAPTPAPGDSDTSIATTAFVAAAIAATPSPTQRSFAYFA